MPKIKLLSADVIKKIAAGEVVEKPASIVKELVENSIDAGATEISVELKNGGIDYIKISDNGSGMEAADLEMSTKLHATSKLEHVEDLQAIMSLGFRGEALASIAAVTDLEIVSASKNGEAFLLTSENEIQPTSRNQGTTVTIKNLFRQVPARRKFLKSARAEETAIRLLVKQFAVNFPQLSWKYIVDGKTVLERRPGKLNRRLTELFNYTESDLIPIVSQEPDLSIEGFVVHPRLAQKRGLQYIFINQRIVKSALIAAAVKQAYAEKIPRELQPSFFLKLNLTGSEVDVNIHPRKEEVKFSDESKLFRFVLRAVQAALSSSMRAEFSERFTNIVNTPVASPREQIENYNQPKISQRSKEYRVQS